MVFGKLLPREGNFFELFNQHGGHIVAGARAFQQMLEHYGNLTERERLAGVVDEAEQDADRVTAEVNRLLHTTFITPLDRDQIHGLINALDDILDLMQDAAETMSLYDVRHVTAEAVQLGQLSARCCERVQHAVSLLPKLSQPTAVEAARKTCKEIDQLESEADKVMRTGMSRLFREEQDVRELIKLKAVYEMLETITDLCKDVATQIEGIVLENS